MSPSSPVDSILAQVGWLAARGDLKDALTRYRLELADDWLDFLTEQAVALAERSNLPFETVAEGYAKAARQWWP